LESKGPESGSLAELAKLGPSVDTLWSRIAPRLRPGTRRTIVFTGTEHQCGTSTAACCAAVGLARHLRAQVVLVELGAGSSSLAQLLGLPQGPGLFEILCDGAPVKDCIRSCGLEGLAVVTAGRGVLPAGVLASELARKVFEQLGAGMDFVLIDAPPIQAHPELHPILLHAEEAVLVFEAEHTRREQARELMEIVTRAGLSVLGSVLNQA
jgi:Mrp family chromosome partitioning ATPase